jgi:hypothetical protein
MKTLGLIATLGGLLLLAVGSAWYVWSGLEGVPMSTNGVVALILGVLVSLAVGVGLMWLVYYSHKRGYDDIGTPRK